MHPRRSLVWRLAQSTNMHVTHTKLLHTEDMLFFLYSGVDQVRAFSATCLPYAVTIRSGKSRYHVEVTHYNPRCNPGSAKKEYVHSEPQLLREIPPSSSVNASLGREAISPLWPLLPIIASPNSSCIFRPATSGARRSLPRSATWRGDRPPFLPLAKLISLRARNGLAPGTCFPLALV